MNDDIIPLLHADPLRVRSEKVMQAFLAGRSETTLRAYRKDLGYFADFTGGATVPEAAHLLLSQSAGEANALALDYRNYLIEKGLKAATIKRRLAVLRSLAKLARTVGVIQWTLETPFVQSEPYRDTRGPGKEGFRRMLDGIQGEAPRALRDRAMLRLLYDLALRRGEVISLDRADLDLERATILVRGKGRSEKSMLSLAPQTAAALREWLAARGTNPGPLFTNFDRAQKGDGRLTANYLYKIVRGLGERTGIKTAPHGLRHTAITEACKAAQAAGIGLEEVMDFSRHKSVAVLMIYRDRERNVQGKLAALVAGTGDAG